MSKKSGCDPARGQRARERASLTDCESIRIKVVHFPFFRSFSSIDSEVLSLYFQLPLIFSTACSAKIPWNRVASLSANPPSTGRMRPCRRASARLCLLRRLYHFLVDTKFHRGSFSYSTWAVWFFFSSATEVL